MNRVIILLIVVVFLSAASICQADGNLEAKLARLETGGSQSTAAEKSKSRGKSLAERIDDMEARQNQMQKVDKGMDTRISKLEGKLRTMEFHQQSNEAIITRIAKLESKVQVLEVQSKMPQVYRKSNSQATGATCKSQPDVRASETETHTSLGDALAIKLSKLLNAPVPEPGFEITADYLGKYVWRGQNLNDDPVFQPGVSMTMGGLTAGVWASQDTTTINGQNGEFTEWDYSLDYSGDVPIIEGVGYSLGVINYHFPSVVGDTTEVYWGLNFDMPLSPSFTLYHDIDVIDGTYAEFGLGHSIEKIAELGPETPVGMDIGASVGWGSASYNKGYWSTDESKLNDLALSVSFPFEIGGWSVTPSLNYVTLLDSRLRDTDTFSEESEYFFVGISAAKGF